MIEPAGFSSISTRTRELIRNIPPRIQSDLANLSISVLPSNSLIQKIMDQYAGGPLNKGAASVHPQTSLIFNELQTYPKSALLANKDPGSIYFEQGFSLEQILGIQNSITYDDFSMNKGKGSIEKGGLRTRTSAIEEQFRPQLYVRCGSTSA